MCEELHPEGNQLQYKLKHENGQDDNTETVEDKAGVDAMVAANCSDGEGKKLQQCMLLQYTKWGI